MIKVASFFSGIGGFDYAVESAGMEVVFQCEINQFCQKVLRKHWPDVSLYSDINKIKLENIPHDANLWCAGFPCQDLSSANQGKRKGLNGERSGLFYRFAELVSERKPEWLIIENVPGMLNSHNGEDFEKILKTLDEFGYGVSWRVFDAKYFGTPQRRRRVYIVASLGSIRSASVLFDTKSIAIAPRAGLGEKDIIAKKTGTGIQETNCYSIQHAGIGRKPEAGPQAKGYRNDGETYTLDSRGSADAVCKENASFRIRNTSGISKRMDGSRYRAIGNAVCVHVVQWIAERLLAVSQKKINRSRRA